MNWMVERGRLAATVPVRMVMIERWTLCGRCGSNAASVFRELRVLRTRANFLRDITHCRVCQSGSWHVAKRAVRDTLKRAVLLAAVARSYEGGSGAACAKEDWKRALLTALDYVMTVERGDTLGVDGRPTMSLWTGSAAARGVIGCEKRSQVFMCRVG